MTREECVELAGGDTELLFADGFDQAILGVARVFSRLVVLYDYHAVIDRLVLGGMDREEAVEYFEFNIVGAYVGDRTPAFAVTRKEG